MLAEAGWKTKKLALYTRYEWVQKSLEELNLDEATYGQDAVFAVNALTIGLNYDLLNAGQTRLAIGVQGMVYQAPSTLNTLYGKNPLTAEVYIRIYPGMMNMKM